jgi:hypothetical protein
LLDFGNRISNTLSAVKATNPMKSSFLPPNVSGIRIARKCSLFFGVAITLLATFSANHACAAAFTLGDLVVVRAGDGSAALNGNATAAFLDEYTTAGVLVQSIPLPTLASGGNQPLTLSGSATSEGFISLSQNGMYLTLGGYAATVGTVTPQTSSAATVNRVIGRIDLLGNINTTTSLGDAYNGSNIRSVTSSDGVNFWTGGNGGSGQGASAGTRYTTLGGTTSQALHSTTTNVRVVNLFNGQLYADSSSSPFLGVGTVGTGMPTTSGQTYSELPGFPTSGTHSSYDFWFKDPNTLYVADDGSAASGGGIQKWTLSAGTWSLAYTLGNNGTTTTAVRGLAGTVDGSGNAVLYGTTGSALVSVTDTGAGSAVTSLATAPANTGFRGVELLVVPEPSTAALTGFGLLALALFRRFRR